MTSNNLLGLNGSLFDMHLILVIDFDIDDSKPLNIINALNVSLIPLTTPYCTLEARVC